MLPRVEAVKRPACTEGARMAFAYVKMHWAKMKAIVVATEGPPEGKDHRKPERYLGCLSGCPNSSVPMLKGCYVGVNVSGLSRLCFVNQSL